MTSLIFIFIDQRTVFLSEMTTEDPHIFFFSATVNIYKHCNLNIVELQLKCSISEASLSADGVLLQLQNVHFCCVCGGAPIVVVVRLSESTLITASVFFLIHLLLKTLCMGNERWDGILNRLVLCPTVEWTFSVCF